MATKSEQQLYARARKRIEPSSSSTFTTRQKPGPSYRTPPIITVFIIALSTSLVLLVLRKQPNKPNKPNKPNIILSSLSIPPSDNEEKVSRLELSSINGNTRSISQDVIGCMPSVRRADGKVEYVGNAVKSWGLATGGGSKVGKLIVFDMNVDNAEIVKEILGGDDGRWWEVKKRKGMTRNPRVLTHGDSIERVRWRSKEALDYAEVLERCMEEAIDEKFEFVLVVQDDVLFTSDFGNVVERLRNMIVDKDKKWCYISLFDIGSTRDGQEQDTSNMVAKVFDIKRVRRLARYIQSKFDQSPVDWLVDEYCRAWGLRSFVLVPNLVRHRGKVSSFEGNTREGLLT